MFFLYKHQYSTVTRIHEYKNETSHCKNYTTYNYLTSGGISGRIYQSRPTLNWVLLFFISKIQSEMTNKWKFCFSGELKVPARFRWIAVVETKLN